jgi:hypothetical protein
MEEVIQWLKTPEGEAWSKRYHLGTEGEGGNPARFSHGLFATVKFDHECHFDGKKYVDCEPYCASSVWIDRMIKDEIEKYGMNGLGQT